MSRRRKKEKLKLRKEVKNFLVFLLILFVGFLVYKKSNNISFAFSDKVISIDAPKIMYLALNDKVKPDITIKTKNNKKAQITYKSENEKIITIEDDNFKANNIGETNVTISSENGLTKNIKVVVTDLIQVPSASLNDAKKRLSCEVYSEEEVELLDKILLTRIETAGYKTRAGVVAAARFLTLEFPYKINYFYENGRLSGTDRDYIDGEGRYYHKGLYLSKSKYSTLAKNASTASPKIWGCELYDNATKSYSPNGLNCSGFVSWAMLNGGFDVGDIGAGITEQHDFTDIGEKVKIDEDLLNSGKVKVGDLIGRNGHIAIIIGLEDNTIYVAESYVPNLKLRTFTKEDLLASEDFNYIMLMDSVYLSDGNLTNMW